jgi:uncharacterized protein with HEPN domain
MNPESRKRLRDAHTACTEIALFLRGESRASFGTDRRLHLAVQLLLVVVGEALSVLRRVETDLADQIPDLHRFVGLRNHLVHGYDVVNLDIVWRVASEEVPAFARVASGLLVDELGEAP